MKKIKKRAKPNKKHFIVEINENIDKKVDEALILLDNGRIAQSTEIMKRLMMEHPEYHSVQYGMGVVYAFKEQYDDAIQCFSRAVSIFPYFIEAQFNLAVSLQKKLDVGNTIRAFQKVTGMGSPGEPLVIEAQGFLSRMEESIRKNDGVGIDAYLKSLDRFEKAFACMEMQKWEEAIFGFKECLSIVKKHFQSYGNMGICYAKLNKREQALAAFDRALEINPKYEIAKVNREVILSLREGEALSEDPVESVNYSRDYAAPKRSYIKEMIEAIRRK